MSDWGSEWPPELYHRMMRQRQSGGGEGAAADFSPFSLVLFEAMEEEPNAARKVIIDTCIKALVAAGVWDLLDVFCVYAAHTSQAGLLNWKSPGTYDSTLTNAPAFTADQGFAGNGSNAFINTNFNPSTAVAANFVQDSAHVSFRSRAITMTMPVVGGLTGAGLNMYPRFNDGNFYARINDLVDTGGFAVPSGVGWFMGNRSGALARQAYRNGASVGDYGDSASGPLNNENIWLLNLANTAFSDAQLSSMSIGGSLDSTKMAAFYAAELAYMQAIGAV